MIVRGLSSLLCLMGLAGCVGDLDDQGRFLVPAGSCDEAGALEVTRARCSSAGCHAGAEPAADLDLDAEGLTGRLRDVASTCGGRLLVDSTNVGASYALEKLDDMPECGSTMPLLGDLRASEHACLTGYLRTIALDDTP